MLEKRIEIRWRDVDAYGHVNNAVYLNYLEEARDAWVQSVLGPVSGTTWDFVLARVEIDFRAELTQDDRAVIVRCTLDRIGRSSIGTREEVRKADGSVSAARGHWALGRRARTRCSSHRQCRRHDRARR